MKFSELVASWIDENYGGTYYTRKYHGNSCGIYPHRLPSLELGFAHDYIAIGNPYPAIDLIDGAPGIWINGFNEILRPEDPQCFQKLSNLLETETRRIWGSVDELG